MAPNIENICLFAGSHAVEVMTFSVIFDLPLDHVDIRRFEDNIPKIEKVYPSIKNPEIIQIAIAPSGQNPPPPPIPIKELSSYLRNGKPEWSGSYGKNEINVSCHKYKGWEQSWPEAERRLDILLDCVNSEKPVRSVDYKITNSFNASRNDNVLNPCALFKNSSDFIAPQILQLADARWHFNQGWFDAAQDRSPEILVHINGQGRLENDQVIANIGIHHAHRQRNKAGTLLEKFSGQSLINQIFNDLHDKSKILLKELLTDDLVDRMDLNA
ncbi:MAG: TIGR04255 family protein [Roseovarius sp.]|nr:TIGR04255 family protein [Roseovarius sp.]